MYKEILIKSVCEIQKKQEITIYSEMNIKNFIFTSMLLKKNVIIYLLSFLFITTAFPKYQPIHYP